MKVIVTTTIFPPSKALEEFEKFSDWKLIVVGDLKTPHELYRFRNLIYLDPEFQETHYKTLSDLLGWNTIQRRNIGYLEALKMGATVIASVDDDNIPYEGWGQNLILDIENTYDCYNPTNSSIRVFDPLSPTNYNHLWHRGYPINKVHQKNSIEKTRRTIKADVQADFWNGDPDIDAIARMVYKPNTTFDNSVFPFTSDCISPFNSQNTFFTRKALKNYFLFPFVGRLDDIWGAFYCLAKGNTVVYNKATVFQDRNEHNILNDFSKEVIGYMNNDNLITKLYEDPENIKDFLPENSYLAYKEYMRIISTFD